MKKKTLYITSGVPNAGKTTFINQRIEALGGIHISRDNIRMKFLKPGDYYFKNEGKVFNAFIKEIQKAIDNPKGEDDIYIDATHLNARSRSKVINKLNLTNVDKIVVLWFDIPIEELYRRNNSRTGKKLPEDMIANMRASMDTPLYGENRLYEIWRIDGEGWIEEIKKRSIMAL